VATTKAPRRIVILAFPGVQPLDVIGPAEVFAGADALAGGGAYTVEVVAKVAGPITTRSSGYGIVPKTTIARCRGPIDTLVIAGGFGVAKAEDDPGLIRWIRSAARRSRRVTSVCSGAFLLARAGLLEGRTVTTHWASTAELARRHPELTVDPNPIFVRDGNVWTSAGVTSGMDLSLALVEEDLGREQLIARGLAPGDVDRVIQLVDRAEYKRRQQPPGIKVTSKAFGRDRRMPITNRYRG